MMWFMFTVTVVVFGLPMPMLYENEITIRNANELVQYFCCPSIVLNFRQICPDFYQLNMIDAI